MASPLKHARVFGPATGTLMTNHGGGATESFGFPNAAYQRPNQKGTQHGADQAPHFIDTPNRHKVSGTGVPEGQGRAFYTHLGRGTGR